MKFNKYRRFMVVFLAVGYCYFAIYPFMPQSISILTAAAILVMSIVDILSLKIKRTKLISYILLLIATAYITILAQNAFFLISVLIGIIYVNSKDKDLIKAFFYSSLIFFLFTIFLYAIGMITDIVAHREVGNNIIIRLSLGFSNPNTPMLRLLPIILSGYYLFNKNVNYYLISLISTVVLYKLTDSRTGVFCILGFLILSLIFNKKEIVSKRTNLLFMLMFLIMTAISIYSAFNLGADPRSDLNELLSYRPYYWSYYAIRGSFLSPLGDGLNSYVPLDNMYLEIIVSIGLVSYAIYAYIYTRGVKLFNRDTKLLLIMTAFLVYGLFEAGIMVCGINFMTALIIKKMLESYQLKQGAV